MEEEGRTWVIRRSESKGEGRTEKMDSKSLGQGEEDSIPVCQHSRMTMANRNVLPSLS